MGFRTSATDFRPFRPSLADSLSPPSSSHVSTILHQLPVTDVWVFERHLLQPEQPWRLCGQVLLNAPTPSPSPAPTLASEPKGKGKHTA